MVYQNKVLPPNLSSNRAYIRTLEFCIKYDTVRFGFGIKFGGTAVKITNKDLQRMSLKDSFFELISYLKRNRSKSNLC